MRIPPEEDFLGVWSKQTRLSEVGENGGGIVGVPELCTNSPLYLVYLILQNSTLYDR